MVLARVIYELFETEAGIADVADRAEPVYLSRQLRLEFTDTTPVFIAWTWGLLPESDYHVGWSHESFCKGPLEVELDATRTAIWIKLVGHSVSLHFRDAEQQVLEVRSPETTVFCCSFEQWWHADTLYIGRSLPEAVGDPGGYHNHPLQCAGQPPPPRRPVH